MANEKVTIKEIAQNTGVSLGTVHRVIHGKEGVGAKTRERILAEIERTHYQIDSAAASLKRKTLVIAVVLPKSEGDERFYFRGLWKGIRLAAEKLMAYKIEFRYIESSYGLKHISLELQNLFDTILDDINGIITVSDDEETGKWIQRFHRQGVMVITVSSYSNPPDCLCSIRVDHGIAGQLAAEYLDLTLQHQDGKLLILTGNQGIFSNKNYSEGFIRYETDRGNRERLILADGFGMGEIRAVCEQVLQEEPIIGIFSCTARNTYSICKILEEMGRQDICLVGTDVFEELGPYFQNGTINASIYQYNVEQGEAAVEILYRYLTNAELEQKNVCLPVGIVLKSNHIFYIS